MIVDGSRQTAPEGSDHGHPLHRNARFINVFENYCFELTSRKYHVGAKNLVKF